MAVVGGGAAVVSSISSSLLLVAPPLPLVSHFLLCSNRNSFCGYDRKHETIATWYLHLYSVLDLEADWSFLFFCFSLIHLLMSIFSRSQ